jgi:cation transport ATPase
MNCASAVFSLARAAGILVNFGVVLDPAVGAILMSLSIVIVAINSQTLRRYGPKVEAKEMEMESARYNMEHMSM